MRVVFMGTPDFSVPVLDALVEAGHEIDHLNGKLFIDYLTGLKRQLITRKMVKLKREQAREKDSA
jgi:hypothetical protein